MKKPTQPRPRKMWANYYRKELPFPCVHGSRRVAREHSMGVVEPLPVAVVPLDDRLAILEKAMRAFREADSCLFSVSMAAALTAIGVLPRSRKGRK